MKKFNDIVGFHIEPTNICTLKCPGCARTKFIDKWPQHWKNYNIDIQQLLDFLDIDLREKTILLCGNYGDPIYHPNLETLISELKNKGASITIVTNGSYKTEKWWTNLVRHLDGKDHVQFSIDGTPENFKNYRKNADWTTIESAIKIASKADCIVSWKHIVFSYNQTTISQSEEIANSLGVSKFVVSLSDRFDEFTDYLRPDPVYVGSRYQNQQNFKKNIKINKINAACDKNNQHFISAAGYYTPCCYVGDHRFYYKTDFGKNKKKYSIANNKLSLLLEQQQVIDFYSTLQNQSVCQYNCPSNI
jgi:organic radical activating enzyme